MAQNSKNFVISTADVAFYHNDILAFTGTTSLNTSISVEMDEEEIKAGKGSKTLYKYKYGRKLSATVEEAEWSLAYIAAQVGSEIESAAKQVYQINECVTLDENGEGTLNKIPTGSVSVVKPDGSMVEVGASISTSDATGVQVATITITDLASTTVRVTYPYTTDVQRVTVDAEASPFVGRNKNYYFN